MSNNSSSSSLPPKKNLLQRSTPADNTNGTNSTSSASSTSTASSSSNGSSESNPVKGSKENTNEVTESSNIFRTFDDSMNGPPDLTNDSCTAEEIGNFIVPQTDLDDDKEKIQSADSADDGVPRHTPGDLVWARVSGYPWWPSMVTNDPIQNMFFKTASSGNKKVLYHVQFFGSVPERAWINWRNLVKYESATQFDKLPSAVNPKSKGKKGSRNDKRSEKNEVPPSKKLWWEDSVKEANEATLVDKYVRLDRYLKFKQTDQIPDALFSPTIPLERIGKKETTTAAATAVRKRESTTPLATSVASTEKGHSSLSKSETASKKIKSDPDFVQEVFNLYKAKHLTVAKTKFPDYDDDDLEAFLLLQWKNLDQRIKDKYKKRYENPELKVDSGDETDPGDEESLINRARPLRKCVLTLGTNAYKGTQIEGAKPEEESAPKSSGEPSPPKIPAANKRNQTVNNSNMANSSDSSQTNPRSTSTKGRPAKGSVTPSSPAVAVATNVENSSAVNSNNNSSNSNASLIVLPELSCRSPVMMLTEDEALEQANAEGHMDEEDEEITGCRAAKKEFVCKTCETSGELLLCEGHCSGAFHLSCLGLEEVPEGEFLCEECKRGKHSCFVCRSKEGVVKACGVLYCGKYYHEECLKGYPLARLSYQGQIVCPLHACASCGFHKKNSPDVFRGKMYRCVRCPVAYHCGDADACLAAGCAIIAPNSIICCKHFMPVKNNKNHQHINVSWCFVCSQGGSLLCCERCPASFHLKCIGLSKLPKETWFCNSCTLGLRPRYGDILWAKVQNYRWWPAEVIFPRLIPQKSLEEPHQVGEFIVQLFATKEYHWVHIGLTFLFHENDKNFHEPGEKHYPKNFQIALEKASQVLTKRKSFTRKSALPSLSNQTSPKASDLLKPVTASDLDSKSSIPVQVAPRVPIEPETSFLPLLNQPNSSSHNSPRNSSPLSSARSASVEAKNLGSTTNSSKGAVGSPAKRPASRQKTNRDSASPWSSSAPAKKPRGRPSDTAKKQQELVQAAAALMAKVSSASISANASKASAEKTSGGDTFNLNGPSSATKSSTSSAGSSVAAASDLKVLPRKDVKQPASVGSKPANNPKITNITPPASPCTTKLFSHTAGPSPNKLEPLTVQTESSSNFNMPHVPENYKLVYQNTPCDNVQVYSADITEITPCECKGSDPDPCGPTSDCWNRLLCVECHPKVCRSGDRCSNQRFQKAQYPRFEIFYTKSRGWGLKTKDWIRKGDFVNEYCGDLIDIEECQRRLGHQNTIGDFNFYFCVLDKERIIDAGPRGNFSRFMNHSCDPNCETQKWTVNGDIRVGLFALTDINPGSELTFNYNMDCLGNSKLKCKCNSPSCSGYIGMKPLKGGSSNLDKDRKRKRRDRREKPMDQCYRCGNPGAGSKMISCGRQFCGKIYHRTCLKAEEVGPNALHFECPLHVCDVCAKVAVYICSQCDHSTCQEHEKGLMYELDDHTFRCKFHYHLLIERSRPHSMQQPSNLFVNSNTKAIQHNQSDGSSATNAAAAGSGHNQTGPGAGQRTLLEVMAASSGHQFSSTSSLGPSANSNNYPYSASATSPPPNTLSHQQLNVSSSQHSRGAHTSKHHHSHQLKFSEVGSTGKRGSGTDISERNNPSSTASHHHEQLPSTAASVSDNTTLRFLSSDYHLHRGGSNHGNREAISPVASSTQQPWSHLSNNSRAKIPPSDVDSSLNSAHHRLKQHPSGEESVNNLILNIAAAAAAQTTQLARASSQTILTRDTLASSENVEDANQDQLSTDDEQQQQQISASEQSLIYNRALLFNGNNNNNINIYQQQQNNLHNLFQHRAGGENYAQGANNLHTKQDRR